MALGHAGLVQAGGISRPVLGQKEAQGEGNGHLALGQRQGDERLTVGVLAHRPDIMEQRHQTLRWSGAVGSSRNWLLGRAVARVFVVCCLLAQPSSACDAWLRPIEKPDGMDRQILDANPLREAIPRCSSNIENNRRLVSFLAGIRIVIDQSNDGNVNGAGVPQGGRFIYMNLIKDYLFNDFLLLTREYRHAKHQSVRQDSTSCFFLQKLQVIFLKKCVGGQYHCGIQGGRSANIFECDANFENAVTIFPGQRPCGFALSYGNPWALISDHRFSIKLVGVEGGLGGDAGGLRAAGSVDQGSKDGDRAGDAKRDLAAGKPKHDPGRFRHALLGGEIILRALFFTLLGVTCAIPGAWGLVLLLDNVRPWDRLRGTILLVPSLCATGIFYAWAVYGNALKVGTVSEVWWLLLG